MSLGDLLSALAEHGVQLSVRGDALVLTGFLDALPGRLLAEVRARKADILQLRASSSGEDVEGSYPASFGQARLAFLHNLRPASAAYNVAASLHIRGGCDLAALVQALNWLIRRHEALRTFLGGSDGRFLARVAPNLGYAIPQVDLSGVPPGAAARELERLRLAIASTGFNLRSAPLWRCLLVHMGDDLELVVALHHFIADGWSIARALREIAAAYASARTGREPSLPAPRARYGDYARWLSRELDSPRGQAALAWWRETLAGFDAPLAFPTSLSRPAVLSDRGDRISWSLDAATTGALRRFAAERRTTVAAVLSAVHAALLYRFSRSPRFLVGVAVSNRPSEEFQDVFGFFVNWLPVPVDFSRPLLFEAFLAQWSASRLAALHHQDTPFDAIARVMRCEADLARHPLFQHMVVSHVPARRVRFGDLAVSVEPLSTRSSKLDMVLFVTDSAGAVPIEGSGEVLLEIEYSTDLFERPTVEALGDAFVALLGSALETPDRPVDALAVLPPALIAQLRSVAQGPVGSRLASPLHLVRASVSRSPEATAIIQGGEAVSYARLAARVAGIAQVLRDHGVIHGDRVAVLLPRTPDLLAALLGVMMCGACFVPLDAALPPARLSQMVDDAEPSVLLTTGGGEATWLAGSGQRQLRVEDLPRDGGDGPWRWIDGLDAGDIAYLLYTSGSTGRPKGVLGAHGPLASFVEWLNAYLGSRPIDRVLCKTPLGFDASLREIMAPLAAGATLVLAGEEEYLDPAALARLLVEWEITILHATPTIYREILGAAREDRPSGEAPALRHVMCGGEALNPTLVNEHFAAHPGARLHNVYGPTECTIDATAREVRRGEDPVPLGRPIAGAAVYLTGPDLSFVPPGARGEIVIGGIPPGPGYWRRPDDQEASFVVPTSGPLAGERVYRTGDLGRRSPDGLLFFEGRIDRQVKVRGARIELEEVERAMLRHPGVVAAMASLRSAGERPTGLIGLVQFAPTVASPAAEIECLGSLLASSLPAYMRPDEIVHLPEVPRLANGKIDHRAAAALGERLAARRDVSLLTTDEAVIAELMGSVLPDMAVSRSTDFFRAGGHSLNAARLLARLTKRTGAVITMRELFEHPTIGELAILLGSKRAAARRPPDPVVIQAVRRPRGLRD